jgi:serine/threonine-protein kinase
VCPCGALLTVDRPAVVPSSENLSGNPVEPLTKPCPTCGRILVIDDPNVGRVVLNKWRLERRLGQGGMGTVYLATELAVEREVALKFLHAKLAARDEYRSRFEQEARIMAKVEHPNLASLYGVERDGAVPFLVMRFVRGKPLSRVMKDKKVFTLEEALPLIIQIAAALSALHVRGYVHRDLKPGNVIVSDEGHVTLLDFGLTRTHNPNLTRPGVALGSPQYMSPEQVLGGSLDPRSDLYTLGLLTSELLVGHRPYKDEETKIMLQQHLQDEPEPPHVANPRVSESVSRVLLKALSKRPSERQASVEAFIEELLQAGQVGPVTLPRRETAEAMLANVSNKPSLPEPEKRDGVEVAEVLSADVVGPEPASGEPISAPPTVPQRRLAQVHETVLDIQELVKSSKSSEPLVPTPTSGQDFGQLKTDLVPVWVQTTDRKPAVPRPTAKVGALPQAGATDETTEPKRDAEMRQAIKEAQRTQQDDDDNPSLLVKVVVALLFTSIVVAAGYLILSG